MRLGQILLMIEDKLSNPRKNCFKCVKEHLLLAEAINDNLLRMYDECGEKTYEPLMDMSYLIRKVLRSIEKMGNDPKKLVKLSQKIREIRKIIINENYNTDKPKFTKAQKEKLRRVVNHKCARKIMPVLDPIFNIREIVKNLYLINDHLTDKERRCMDCLRKHMLIVEAFIEEGFTLDKNCKYFKIFEKLQKQNTKARDMLIKGERDNYYDISVLIKKMITPKLLEYTYGFTPNCIRGKYKQ
jgi:hypothetical protein